MKFKGEPLTLTHVEVEVRSLGGEDAFKAAFLVSIELVDSILGFIALGSAGFYVDLKAKTVRKLLARPLYRH